MWPSGEHARLPKCFSTPYLPGWEPEVIRAAKKIRRHLRQKKIDRVIENERAKRD
jgi:hypothetical protein